VTAKRRLHALFAAAALALALAGPGNAAPPPREAQISVVAFNVLAPLWAAPNWYPGEMDMSLLDTEFRRERIIRFLTNQASTTDVFCLQEVQQSELPYFLAALGPVFRGFMAHNDPDWWSNWLVPEILGRRTGRRSSSIASRSSSLPSATLRSQETGTTPPFSTEFTGRPPDASAWHRSTSTATSSRIDCEKRAH
jgi:hypothetical protein